jgi:hypothetical protein
MPRFSGAYQNDTTRVMAAIRLEFLHHLGPICSTIQRYLIYGVDSTPRLEYRYSEKGTLRMHF